MDLVVLKSRFKTLASEGVPSSRREGGAAEARG
jgi:hypothetical protein